MMPVTYYPVATQRQFEQNRQRIQGKPYAKYFNGDLWLHDEVLPVISKPMPASAALRPTAEGLNTLLDPGYHEVETGFCELPDGSAYVASLVPFSSCTGEMFQWWFWWHSVEPARYILWYPYNHVSADPIDRGVLTRPGLTAEQRYIGNTHRVTEYIGPDLLKIAIRFVDPAEFGFDTSRFAGAGIVGHACAEVRLQHPNLPMTTMVHLARRTKDGFELRSRYWIGRRVRLNLGGRSFHLDRLFTALGLKHRLLGLRVAYEQVLHDQIEFTHLSTFLADIYSEFGPGEQGRRVSQGASRHWRAGSPPGICQNDAYRT